MYGLDGRAVTPAPSNMTVVPTEIWENRTSMTIEKRAILENSGGVGKWMGGAGQEVIFRNDTGNPLEFALMGQRTEFSAKGLLGGIDGALREYLVNGETVDPKARITLLPGDRITMREAGGGGYGSPYERVAERVLKDVERRWETIERARDIYGVVLTGSLDNDDLAIDQTATEATRDGA